LSKVQKPLFFGLFEVYSATPLHQNQGLMVFKRCFWPFWRPLKNISGRLNQFGVLLKWLVTAPREREMYRAKPEITKYPASDKAREKQWVFLIPFGLAAREPTMASIDKLNG
jgi:hypothetical protein